MIHASWGGTRIETWMSREDLLADPDGAREVARFEQPPDDPEARRAHELFISNPVAWLREQIPADPGNTGKVKGWAWVREAQARALDLPGTGMAVTLDIGDGEDIHPRNKQEVGRRLALLALHRLFGGREPDCGPEVRLGREQT